MHAPARRGALTRRRDRLQLSRASPQRPASAEQSADPRRNTAVSNGRAWARTYGSRSALSASLLCSFGGEPATQRTRTASSPARIESLAEAGAALHGNACGSVRRAILRDLDPKACVRPRSLRGQHLVKAPDPEPAAAAPLRRGARRKPLTEVENPGSSSQGPPAPPRAGPSARRSRPTAKGASADRVGHRFSFWVVTSDADESKAMPAGGA